MSRRRILLGVLLFASIAAAWLHLRDPGPMRALNDIRGVVCTPGYLLRLSQEKAPMELPAWPFAPDEGDTLSQFARK